MRIVLALVTSLILIAVAVAPLPSLRRVAAQARLRPRQAPGIPERRSASTR